MKLLNQAKALEIYNNSNFVNHFRKGRFWKAVKDAFDEKAAKFSTEAFLLYIYANHFYGDDYGDYGLLLFLTSKYPLELPCAVSLNKPVKFNIEEEEEAWKEHSEIFMCVLLIELEFFLKNNTKYPYNFILEEAILEKAYSPEDFNLFLECEVYYKEIDSELFMMDTFLRNKTDYPLYEAHNLKERESIILNNRFFKYYRSNSLYEEVVEEVLKKYGSETEVARQASEGQFSLSFEAVLRFVQKRLSHKTRPEQLLEELEPYTNHNIYERNAFAHLRNAIDERRRIHELYQIEIINNISYVYALSCCVKYDFKYLGLNFMPDESIDDYNYDDICQLGNAGVQILDLDKSYYFILRSYKNKTE